MQTRPECDEAQYGHGSASDRRIIQYLKPLERYTMISTWADLMGSLCQHLAIDTHTHKHTHAHKPSLPGNRDHGETFLRGRLTPHRSGGCQVGSLQISAETPASQSPTCTAAPASGAGLPFVYI